MLRLKSKKRQSSFLTKEDVRTVVQEELLTSETNRKKLDVEDKRKKLAKQKLEAMSPHKRLKLLRYLHKKGVKGEK